MIKNNKGFNLFVLTILVFCVGLLMAASLRFYEFSSIRIKTLNTAKKMNKIEQALRNFVIENNRFPCPAQMNCDNQKCDSLGQRGVELRNVDGSCGVFGVFSSTNSRGEIIYYGTVPTIALGLSNDIGVDEWYNKIVYIIPRVLTNDNSIQLFLSDKYNTETVLSNKEYVQEYKPSGALTSIDETSGIMFVLMSYNRIREGAFQANSKSPNYFSGFDNKPINNFTVDLTNKNLFTLFRTYKTFSLSDLEMDLMECPETQFLHVEGKLFTFRSAKPGETVFSVEECPNVVNYPPKTTDYYYISSSKMENRPAKVCERGGKWQSGDFKHTCKLVGKCSRPLSIGQGATVSSWNVTFPVVNTGEAYDSIGRIRLKCLIRRNGDSIEYYWFRA